MRTFIVNPGVIGVIEFENHEANLYLYFYRDYATYHWVQLLFYCYDNRFDIAVGDVGEYETNFIELANETSMNVIQPGVVRIRSNFYVYIATDGIDERGDEKWFQLCYDMKFNDFSYAILYISDEESEIVR